MSLSACQISWALLRLAAGGLIVGLVTACATNSRIIRQSPNTTILAGEGDSRIEAELAATDRATELYGQFHQTREMECSQEHRGSSDAFVQPGAGYFGYGGPLAYGGRSYSYWQCVLFIAPGPGRSGTTDL